MTIKLIDLNLKNIMSLTYSGLLNDDHPNRMNIVDALCSNCIFMMYESVDHSLFRVKNIFSVRICCRQK